MKTSEILVNEILKMQVRLMLLIGMLIIALVICKISYTIRHHSDVEKLEIIINRDDDVIINVNDEKIFESKGNKQLIITDKRWKSNSD